MDFIRNKVRFIMVTIPEALAVEQLDDVFAKLDRYELKVRRLIINNVVTHRDSDFLKKRSEQQKKYIDAIYSRYTHLEIVELPMFPYELKGKDRLREIEKILFA